MLNEHYKDFDSDDFLQDEFFIQWMYGKDPQINTWWVNWLAQNSRKRSTIESAKRKYTLLRSFKKHKVTDREEQQVWTKIKKRINFPNTTTIRTNWFRWLTAAAACVVIITSLIYYRYHSTGTEYNLTAQKDVSKLTLADGSQIILNKGASLKTYSKINREVWIQGQVYFEIKKVNDLANRRRPFVVHADNFDVNVTGTSFLVTSSLDSKNVVLTQGHVSISSRGISAEMKPGDRIELKNKHFIKQTVNPALYSAWKDKEFKFNNTSLSELKILVRNVYGLEVIINDEHKLRYRVLNGTINISSRENFIKTIQVLLDLNVSIINNKLIIEPKTHF